MTLQEAKDMADRYSNTEGVLRTEIVRILPKEIDPPSDDDDGWDVVVYAE